MMTHEIYPAVLDNQYKNKTVSAADYLLFAKGGELLLSEEEGVLHFPKAADFDFGAMHSVYLFSIDDEQFFLAGPGEDESAYEAAVKSLEDAGAGIIRRREILRFLPRKYAYAAALASQIASWYDNNRFCGHCGRPLVHAENERMMHCPDCGNIVYPRISPVIITAILDGDKVVVSRYAAGPYRQYALIAGYNEVGESIEETLKREVMEEVGLEVENIRYYKCQPWPVTDTLLFGFFCDVKGSRTLKVDKTELSEAHWLSRKEAKKELTADNISLTREMLMLFAEGKEPR